MENTIRCELCGLICHMQVSASHLRAAHQMTTKEYRALGHDTLSPARLAQLRESPVAKGTIRRPTGEDHWHWKGGHIARSGYKVLHRQGGKYLYEHRAVAEEMLGRPLAPDEVVHHKDANRSNNSPDNLVVMKRHEHDTNKEGAKRYFHTGPDCEDAARVLRSTGWSIARIARAIRVESRTVKGWLHPES